MPKIEQTVADVNVRSHTFRFVTPEETDSLKVPNACNLCHKDKTAAWSKDALKGWRRRVIVACSAVALPAASQGKPRQCVRLFTGHLGWQAICVDGRVEAVCILSCTSEPFQIGPAIPSIARTQDRMRFACIQALISRFRR